MKYISISGIDGSGKSTQLLLLKEYLERKGEKVAVFNAVEFSLANRIARFLRGNDTFQPGKEKAVTSASWFSIILREKFLFFDFLRFHCFRRKLARQGCTYLLSDRSFYDSLINIAYLSDAWTVMFGLRVLERIAPHPDTAFYLDIDPEEIMKRDRVPEQGIDYLLKKRRLFLEKASPWNFTLINANRSKEDVFFDIKVALDRFPKIP